MERKKRSVWSSLVLVAAVAGAFWLWRSRTVEESARTLPPTTASASAPGNPAPAEPMQQPAMRGTEALESETPSPEPIPRRPTVTLPQLSSVEVQALGEQALVGPHAWNRHIAPLLYPPGHPAEGTYRDSVTLDQAVEAQLRFYEEVTFGGEEYLNKPQLHIQKHFNYKDLNARRRA